MPTMLYGGGKIQCSYGKDGFRVFRNEKDVVDKVVRWLDDKGAAWSRALDLIDEAHGR